MSSLLETPRAAELAVMATFDVGRLDRRDPIVAELLETSTIEVERERGGRARMLSESARIEALAAVLRERGRDGLEQVRLSLEPHFPSALQQMLDQFLLQRQAPLADDPDALAAALHVERWSTGAFARANLGFERAQPSREEIEGRIRISSVLRPIDALLARGFVGRELEQQRLRAFLRRPVESGGLRTSPAFLVYGVGGMGKSTLVARLIKELSEEGARNGRPGLLWAYLDFDRPTLQPPPTPPDGPSARASRGRIVLEDLTRQITAQRPDARALLEQNARMRQQTSYASGLESVGRGVDHRELAFELGEQLRALNGDGRLVVVLDTFEEVERAGQQAVSELFELFDALAHVLPTLRLVVSGRDPASAFRTAPSNELRVGELSEADALTLLGHLLRAEDERATLEPAAAREVWKLVGRSPLSLQLAARVILAEGIGSISEAARRATTLGRIREEFVRGFLYHRIVDHVSPGDVSLREPLRQIARASLVLRRVTVPAVERILLPAIERAPVTGLAERLFDALRLETGLVQPLDAQTLAVHEDLRAPALAALKLDDKALIGRVHARAASFYESAGDVRELLFHQLAQGNTVAELASGLNSTLVFELEPWFDELPSEAAAALRDFRAKRPELDAAVEQLEWERRAATAADVALQRGDFRAARRALQDRAKRRAGSELYRIEMRVCEAAGDLGGAIDAAKRELDASRIAEQPLRYAGAGVYLAKLLEWRRDHAALAQLSAVAANELLNSERRLKLELVLSRLAAAERMSVESDDARWDWGLQARQLLSRLDASVRNEPALVRLLAATLGRDEATYLRDAVSRVGLDPAAAPERTTRLASALLEWSRTLGEDAATLARALKLRETATSDAALWRSHLSGLGLTGSAVLGEDFWRLRPPASVLEALRQIYLHWGYDPPEALVPASVRTDAGRHGALHLQGTQVSSDASASVTTKERGSGGDADAAPSTSRSSEPHFLDAVPLDFGRKELRELESYILSGYSSTGSLQRLTLLAGISDSKVNWSLAPTLVVRQLFDVLGASARTVDFARSLLADARSPELARRVRQIIGADWLASHGLGGGIVTQLDVTKTAGATGMTTQTLSQFLTSAGKLSDADKRLIIDQARVLMEQLYVHLPLKRAMYATDPVQRLRLLRHRLPDERAFHEEMISIFTGVRDLHTNYILPRPYTQATALLPFQIGEYFDGEKRRYIVSSTAGDDPGFRPGTTVTHWNAVPIDRAVELNARLHAGGNDAAKYARGLQRLTVRPLMMSLPPDEDWVDVRYLDSTGKAQEQRFEWKVLDQSARGAPESSDRGIDESMLGRLTVLGLDVENEQANQVIESVFNPGQVRIDNDIRRFLESRGGGLESVPGVDFDRVSTMPDVFRFGVVPTPNGDLGRIQIRTFNVNDPDAFVAEFVRILALLPQDRLVLDVRGNGGGNILAGEKSLQLFTDATIEPERFHFINSSLVLAMAEGTPNSFGRWLPSLQRAVMTGSVYSQGLPFLEHAEYNQIGRKYPGKVVLLTDAFCYSTTDIFAAGFRDHAIGPILGTMANTGAGGANVFTWELVQYFCRSLPDTPIAVPPRGATFRVAIRRSTRVGANAGEPLEDLGVEPDEVHKTTLRDLLEGDTDLYAHAARMLTS